MVVRRLHGGVDGTPDYSTCYRTYRININLFRGPFSFTLAWLWISLEYFSTLTLFVTEFFPVQNALYCPQLLLSRGSSNFNYNCHHQKMSLEVYRVPPWLWSTVFIVTGTSLPTCPDGLPFACLCHLEAQEDQEAWGWPGLQLAFHSVRDLWSLGHG